MRADLLGAGVPQVAVFDTAFHAQIPEHAYLYAIPYSSAPGLRGSPRSDTVVRRGDPVGGRMDPLAPSRTIMQILACQRPRATDRTRPRP